MAENTKERNSMKLKPEVLISFESGTYRHLTMVNKLTGFKTSLGWITNADYCSCRGAIPGGSKHHAWHTSVDHNLFDTLEGAEEHLMNYAGIDYDFDNRS